MHVQGTRFSEDEQTFRERERESDIMVHLEMQRAQGQGVHCMRSECHNYLRERRLMSLGGASLCFQRKG